MKMQNLQDLYLDQLKDLYSAEKQLIEALPKMAEAATSQELRQGFENHLEQTQTHVERLQQILKRLGANAGRKKCEAMEGLIKEGEHAISLQGNEMVRDAALISAAQRVEHYEIAAYGSVRTYANHLGFQEDKGLLQQTLDEEGDTDKKLTDLAEGSVWGAGINEQALEENVEMAQSKK